MLSLNDEVYSPPQLCAGIPRRADLIACPADVVYPRSRKVLPPVSRRLPARYPHPADLVIYQHAQATASTGRMRHQILTNGGAVDAGARFLKTVPLVWVGAPEGLAWEIPAPRLAFEVWLHLPATASTGAGRGRYPFWEMAVESDSNTAPSRAALAQTFAVHGDPWRGPHSL